MAGAERESTQYRGRRDGRHFRCRLAREKGPDNSREPAGVPRGAAGQLRCAAAAAGAPAPPRPRCPAPARPPARHFAREPPRALHLPRPARPPGLTAPRRWRRRTRRRRDGERSAGEPGERGGNRRGAAAGAGCVVPRLVLRGAEGVCLPACVSVCLSVCQHPLSAPAGSSLPGCPRSRDGGQGWRGAPTGAVRGREALPEGAGRSGRCAGAAAARALPAHGARRGAVPEEAAGVTELLRSRADPQEALCATDKRRK